MSNYHVGIKSGKGRNAWIYVHLPIPDTQTIAGSELSDPALTYRAAAAGSLPDGYAPEAPNLTVGEITTINAGEFKEERINFRFSALDLTNAQRRNEIENGNDNEDGVILMMTDIIDTDSDLYEEIIAPLDWWGYHRDVVI